jgi:hypothetical protein
MMKKSTYPAYRKYPHNRTFFKVISSEMFEELQIIGKHYILKIVEAKILPDRNFIQDLTFDYKNNWIEITETEYNERKNFCTKNLLNFSS